MRRQILLIAALFLFAVGATGLQQSASDGSPQPYNEKHAQMLGLIRTINTIEVTDVAYTSWPVLLERHSDELNAWLAQYGPAQTNRQEAPFRFSDLGEILPGWKLRLNLNADGHGYVVALEDDKDKDGFALVSDE